MGIHKPKDRDEADFARRRLIFDDFFYLQVSLLLSAYFLHKSAKCTIKVLIQIMVASVEELIVVV